MTTTRPDSPARHPHAGTGPTPDAPASASARRTGATGMSSSAPGGRWRRPHPAIASVLVGTLAVVLGLLVVLGRSGPARLPLDPEDTGSRGTRALAQVLRDRGVRTDVVRSPDALAQARVDASTTVVVPDPDLLSRTATDALAARTPARLVLVAPDRSVLDELGLPASLVGRAGSGPFDARCTSPIVDPADTLTGGAFLYRTRAEGASTCFPDPSESSDDPANPASALLDVPASGTRPRTIVLGLPQVFTNVGVTQESHAALALRVLGGTDRVLWYLPEPDPADPVSPNGDGPPAPAWVAPTVLLLAAAALVLCLWRGRRLGPLTTEPLPVVVPAEETTLARARLYRRTGDTAGVGDVLRAAATEDLRRALRLPADADTARIAAATAARVGETDPTPVLDLLTRPLTARELPQVARELQLLRRKVRRP